MLSHLLRLVPETIMHHRAIEPRSKRHSYIRLATGKKYGVAQTTVANAELITKLLVPRRREDIIRRQRLIDLLRGHIHLRVQVVKH